MFDFLKIKSKFHEEVFEDKCKYFADPDSKEAKRYRQVISYKQMDTEAFKKELEDEAEREKARRMGVPEPFKKNFSKATKL